MNLNLGLSSEISQQQQLSLAPQLLQWLRLLQVPSQQLDRLVRHELDTNPALEVDESVEPESAMGEAGDVDTAEVEAATDSDRDNDEWEERFEVLAQLDSEWAEDRASTTRAEGAVSSERMEFRMRSLVDAPTLREHLLRQVAVSGADEKEKQCAAWVVGSLDDRGYVTVPLETLAEESGVSVPDMEAGLAVVQECDPAGVGARDLSECLQLQLSPECPDEAVARRIAADYLEAVARGQREGIARRMGISLAEVEAAIRRIQTLNPNPGSAVSGAGTTQTVTPDVIIRDNGQGGFEIELVEENLPRLRISRSCRALIERGELSRGDVAYVKSRIRAAMFLIDGIEKRGATLRRIAEEIIRVQFRFLRGAESQIRPLTMAKVAGMIGVHDTTVSRALAEKYVDTPVGVFPMRRFFCIGYRCDDGSAWTPDMVRRHIEKIILREDPDAPIKDDCIAKQLQDEGVPVARRTVAKYRGELGLPSSKERHRPPRRLPRAAAVYDPSRPVTPLAAAAG